MACVPIRDLTMQSANWLSASWFVRELTSNHTNEKAERSQMAKSILGISWKDRVTNEEVRVRTGQHSIYDM